MGLVRVVTLGALLASAFSCMQKPEKTPDEGRGTPACNEWVVAFCDYTTRCSGSSASELCAQAKSVECKSDMTASDCATSLPKGACAAFPKGCLAADLADPAPAIRACRKWSDTLCTENARCGADKALCLTELAALVDCTLVIGVKLQYENCLEVVGAAACGDALPAACDSRTLFVVTE